MDEFKEIEQLALKCFEFLISDYSFSEPQVSRHSWMMVKIAYLGTDIGVEIVLDFRDLAVDLHVSRLNSGKPPDCYCTSGERVWRLRLESVFQLNGWGTLPGLLQFANKNKLRDRKTLMKFMKTNITWYSSVLEVCVDRLIQSGSSLFEVDPRSVEDHF